MSYIASDDDKNRFQCLLRLTQYGFVLTGKGATEIEELSKKKLGALDELFEDYQRVNHDIAVRLVELDHPWQETDTNIGGGRSSIISRPQEQLILRHEKDRSLKYLLSLKEDCEHAIVRMDDEQKRIYRLRYTSTNNYDWQEVGVKLNYSTSQIYRKRYAILKLLAEERGMISKDGNGIAVIPNQNQRKW